MIWSKQSSAPSRFGKAAARTRHHRNNGKKLVMYKHVICKLLLDNRLSDNTRQEIYSIRQPICTTAPDCFLVQGVA